MSNQKTISNRLIGKLSIAFFLIMILVGSTYVGITAYFSTKYVEESTQQLNADIANHLIDEKFKDHLPFDSIGGVNKAFFGDLMHDMMAVNQAIEVYLLSETGEVRYSVVLDHDAPNTSIKKVDLEPVEEFIASGGSKHILGDDPRQPEKQKIFSAAYFEKDGQKGYIYIVLAGKTFEEVTGELFGSYFVKLGLVATLITILLATIIGIVIIRYLTRSLSDIIYTFQRFKEGDLGARIEQDNLTDLSLLGDTFNEMADTLVANIDELKSVEKLRRELIANISHDLRSPLAVSSGYIETLLMKKDGLSIEDREKYLQIVYRSLGNLTKLVAQLFEYSKLESDQLKLEKEAFMVSELASDVIANYQVIAEKKGIKLSLNLEKNEPLIFADIGLVERVFQNLIDNAIRFTPENGEIILSMYVDNEKVMVSVKDTGPGISKESQLHIFERFRQAKQSKLEGAGLGLAIVKKILEIHNSTIRVISLPKEGATFEFNLPVYSPA